VPGLLPRLRVKINKNLVKYVGKETANLDVTNIVGISQDDNCTVYDDLVDKILQIRPRDSYKFGLSRSNLIALQKRIRSNGRVNIPLRLQSKTIEKLKQVFSGIFPENYRKNHRKDARNTRRNCHHKIQRPEGTRQESKKLSASYHEESQTVSEYTA